MTPPKFDQSGNGNGRKLYADVEVLKSEMKNIVTVQETLIENQDTLLGHYQQLGHRVSALEATDKTRIQDKMIYGPQPKAPSAFQDKVLLAFIVGMASLVGGILLEVIKFQWRR